LLHVAHTHRKLEVKLFFKPHALRGP
jgi:hypothetical protein